ncbi:PEP/pyruvate-binding domain-containing protein [Nonomuraea soli]|uniref:Pyruvate,water dikinase n=1 Tax=Nonomuraea soli TaxID=1032476 RepID=A0A7W0CDN8_9ACTN|nr:PEP/pyruvate-binding domain-containing protein [Nonomuraea soli]MBA2889243.1 pyruvate,water dikinase [Nonomuraea soli]
MRIMPLDDPSADLATAGGKGASLARLSRAGLPVPPGFVVTTQAYREDPPELPEEILKAYDGLLHLLGPDAAVAVRSSATAEDLPGLSFAGQQDTFLNVRRDGLVEAVRRCWASLHNERAVAYRRRHGVPDDDVAMAVVVQELADAEAAGILFTADPVSGDRSTTVINASWGLGEAVVGGLVTPDTYTVGDAVEAEVSDKTVMTVRTADGTAERPVPEESRRARVLDDARVRELTALGRRIEELYGTPMDVEWALRDGRFLILQARPVTGLREEWNDSKGHLWLWSNGNLGEAIPDVMTPATWSLVQIFIAKAMSTTAMPGFRFVGNIGGRFYMNLSSAHTMLHALGMQHKSGVMDQVMGRLPAGVDVPLIPVGRWQVIRTVVPVAIRLRRRVALNMRKLPAYVAGAQGRWEDMRRKIATSDDLAGLWERELEPYFLETCEIFEASTRQGGSTLVWVRDRLRALAGESDAEAMLTGANHDGGLASLGPVLGLQRLADGEITAGEFAVRYGHRGPHEFEISLPRPGEDPAWIARQAASLGSLDRLLEKQEEARRAAWERFAARHPRKVRPMRREVARWAKVARDRETMRSEVIRVFWSLRDFVLRAGEVTGHGEALFFLSIQEILRVLRGEPMPDVSVRKATYEHYRSLPPYPTVIVGEFDPDRWAASPDRRGDLWDQRGVTAPQGEAVTGFPGAPGVVEGVARVLGGPGDGDRLAQGEILVTVLTNIGWTPLFPRAAAVVTDMGAPLSHASIVARELGIPAVVGTGNATARIHDGDLIRVDGAQGKVEVVQKAGE